MRTQAMGLGGLVLVAVALSLGAQEHLPHWRSTRWGMTPEEVLAALPGEAIAAKNPTPERSGLVPLLEVPAIEIARTTFAGTLLFDKGLLAAVRLEASGGAADLGTFDRVRTLLVEKYGAPTADTSKDINREQIWRLGQTVLSLSELRSAAVGRSGVKPGSQVIAVAVFYDGRQKDNKL